MLNKMCGGQSLLEEVSGLQNIMALQDVKTTRQDQSWKPKYPNILATSSDFIPLLLTFFDLESPEVSVKSRRSLSLKLPSCLIVFAAACSLGLESISCYPSNWMEARELIGVVYSSTVLFLIAIAGNSVSSKIMLNQHFNRSAFDMSDESKPGSINPTFDWWYICQSLLACIVSHVYAELDIRDACNITQNHHGPFSHQLNCEVCGTWPETLDPSWEKVFPPSNRGSTTWKD